MPEFTREDVSNLRRLVELARAWELCPPEYADSAEKIADHADAQLDYEEMRELPPSESELEDMAERGGLPF